MGQVEQAMMIWIRDMFMLFIFCIAGGTIMDYMTAWFGQQQIDWPIATAIVQPIGTWWYWLIFLGAIVRTVWLYLVAIQRVDYATEL